MCRLEGQIISVLRAASCCVAFPASCIRLLCAPCFRGGDAHAKAVAFADYATWAGDECVEQVRALPANGHRGMSMMVAEF